MKRLKSSAIILSSIDLPDNRISPRLGRRTKRNRWRRSLITIGALKDDLPIRTAHSEQAGNLTRGFVGLHRFKSDHLRIPAELGINRQPLWRAPAVRVRQIPVERNVDALLGPVPVDGVIEQHHIGLKIGVVMN